MNYQPANWLVLISLFIAGLSTVDAKECRATATVSGSVTSPVSQVNCNAGGHIWKHLNGIRARPKAGGKCKLEKPPTQKDKTMFLDEKSFLNAFARWKAKLNPNNPKPKNCGPTGTVMDCVPAGQVGVNAALKCTAADPDTGLCTNGNKIVPSHVAFRYLNDKSTGGVWIMNTAYPSENSSCK